MHILTVEPAEQGMKLLSFLSRRLTNSASGNDLHRWIRTGQVRINGKRAHAFDRLAAGDAVRLPPFAAPAFRPETGIMPAHAGEVLAESLRVLAATPDFLALEKPADLATQPGSKQTDSVADILRRRFAGAAYVPAPAHRLDKATSGILLAGRTHAAQEKLHALFAEKTGGQFGAQAEGQLHSQSDGQAGGLIKTYLAWAGGRWPHGREQVMDDHLAKETAFPRGRLFESVHAVAEGAGKRAISRVSLLETRNAPHGVVSLLRITLETGRTHQIRAQLAIRNVPVIGDVKYGGEPFPMLLLHACRLAFPWNGEQVELISFPDWPAPFTVAQACNLA